MEMPSASPTKLIAPRESTASTRAHHHRFACCPPSVNHASGNPTTPLPTAISTRRLPPQHPLRHPHLFLGLQHHCCPWPCNPCHRPAPPFPLLRSTSAWTSVLRHSGLAPAHPTHHRRRRAPSRPPPPGPSASPPAPVVPQISAIRSMLLLLSSPLPVSSNRRLRASPSPSPSRSPTATLHERAPAVRWQHGEEGTAAEIKRSPGRVYSRLAAAPGSSPGSPVQAAQSCLRVRVRFLNGTQRSLGLSGNCYRPGRCYCL